LDRARDGPEAWDEVWGPLLRGKFGDRAGEISMAWLWKKLTLRRQASGREVRGEMLGYPRGGWQPLLERLRADIESRNGRVMIDRPAARLSRARGGGFEIAFGAAGSFRRGHDPAGVRAAGAERYEGVLATVPNEVFRDLLDDDLRAAVGSEYLSRLERIEYHEALCLLLELDRRFSPFYWTNVADASCPSWA
jgi:protoporphyrinogen oxidase